MAELLTTGEFTRWTEADARFKERILDHIEHQVQVNANTDTELALLNDKHSKSAQRNSWLSAIVSTLIAAAFEGATKVLKL